MAEIKIKTTGTDATVPPSTLEARTLGIHKDQLYYGDSNNTPICIITEKNVVVEAATLKITFNQN